MLQGLCEPFTNRVYRLDLTTSDRDHAEIDLRRQQALEQRFIDLDMRATGVGERARIDTGPFMVGRLAS